MKLPYYIIPSPSPKKKEEPRLECTKEILKRMGDWKKEHGIKGSLEEIKKPEFPLDRIEIH